MSKPRGRLEWRDVLTLIGFIRTASAAQRHELAGIAKEILARN